MPVQRPGVFKNVTARAGIHFRNLGGQSGKYYFVETTPGGCALFDYDNDGRLDVFLVQPGYAPGTPQGGTLGGGVHCALYHNDGGGRFSDRTEEAGLAGPMNYAQGVAVGDYDNDGFEDLYVTAYGGNHLYHNDHGRRFIDVTAPAGVGDTDQGVRWATSAAFGDYDNDGRLDLAVLHYTRWSPAADRYCKDPSGQKDYCSPEVYPQEKFRLYHNDGGGHFHDASRETGMDSIGGRGLGLLWIDTQQNGAEDLFIANDLTPGLLLRNRQGHFQDEGLQSGVAYDPDGQTMSGMGVAAADIDGTGHESLMVTNFSAKPDVLFHALPGGRFEDDTYASGVGDATLKTLGFGVAFLDFDRDGLPDILIGNGHVNPRVALTETGTSYAERKQLLHNLDGRQFKDDIADLGDMAEPQVTRGLAVGDYDNDGHLDALANNLGETASLFRNESPDHNAWIRLRLEGTRANRDAAGALVWVTAGAHTQMAECRLSSSFASSCDRRLFFGLGHASAASHVVIRWPDGLRQSFDNAAANHDYQVSEAGPLSRVTSPG